MWSTVTGRVINTVEGFNSHANKFLKKEKNLFHHLQNYKVYSAFGDSDSKHQDVSW
jgi:hypothetical protein